MKIFKQIHGRRKRGSLQSPAILSAVKNKHIAVVPDGNRRWAKEHGLKPWEGHDAGAKTADRFLDWCFIKYKIPILTIYSLSTENLRERSKTEVKWLNKVYQRQFTRIAEDARVHEHEIKVNVLGDLKSLSGKVREATKYAMEKTKNYKKHVVNFLMPYGGRYEIMRATQNIASDAIAKKINPRRIGERLFEKYLFTNGLPDPDLVIRTAEKRLSNFLIWQTAYSEVCFVDKYWPDFNETDLEKILVDFSDRKRNFGR